MLPFLSLKQISIGYLVVEHLIVAYNCYGTNSHTVLYKYFSSFVHENKKYNNC